MWSFIIPIAIIALVAFIFIKVWNDEWEGEVVDKQIVKSQDEDGYTSTNYQLVCKTTDGRTKTVSVKKKIYKNTQNGTKYRKVKHSLKAKPVSSYIGLASKKAGQVNKVAESPVSNEVKMDSSWEAWQNPSDQQKN